MSDMEKEKEVMESVNMDVKSDTDIAGTSEGDIEYESKGMESPEPESTLDLSADGAAEENAGDEVTLSSSDETVVYEPEDTFDGAQENPSSEITVDSSDVTVVKENGSPADEVKDSGSEAEDKLESPEENPVVENHEANENGDAVLSPEVVDEVPVEDEIIADPIDEAENSEENFPDENGDSKLIIPRKYDLSSKQAIREATKILEENRESKAKRDYPWKKLPASFKRTYSERGLKRSILKKIYIPEDRDAVASLFLIGGNEKKPSKLAIPQDLMFTKKEIKKYKYLAKEIKNQNRFLIRLFPLAAVVAVIVLALSWVMANKNRIVRNALIAGCQFIFRAKTDVDYVDVKILDLSITVGGLKVGNRFSVMKNLFEVNRMQCDFDLVQLLKKKFVCENLEASGIAWNTDRKTSCELPEGTYYGSAFSREIQARLDNALRDLRNQAYDLLGGSDVDSIIANVQANINTPEIVEQTIADMNILYEKWKDRPAEYEAKIKEFSSSVQNLRTINLTSFDIRNPDDIARLTESLEKIKTAIDTGKMLTETVQQAVLEVKDDAVNVTDMAKNVSSTVKSDYDYIVERLTTITGTLANLRGLMNNAINTIVYNLLGKYYPYVMDGLDLFRSMKANAPDKPKKEKKASKRAAGTNFNFTPVCPSFLIKNVKISGTGFDCVVKEITNNQNVRYIPTTANLTLNIMDVVHRGKITVDTRSASKEPLVAVNYTGTGYSVGIDGSTIATKCGVPSVNGKAVLSIEGSASNDGFTAGGSIDLNPVSITSDGFENELVTKYYTVGLSSVDRLRFGFLMGYNSKDGFFMNLDGNFAEQFSNALKNVVMEVGKDAKAFALSKLEDFLNNSENEVLAKAKQFMGIEGDIDLQNMTLADVQNALQAKKAEIERMINQKTVEVKEAVTARVEEVKNQATAYVEDNVNEAKQNITDSITNAISSGLGIKKPSKDKEEDGEEDGETDENGNPVSDKINSLTGGFLKGLGF